MSDNISIRIQNQAVVDEAKPGDRIAINRGLYTHWAIYIGDGYIIHLNGPPETFNCSNGTKLGQCAASRAVGSKGTVMKGKLLDVAGDDLARIDNSADRRYTPLERRRIVKRASSQLDTSGYHLLSNNCEHFVNWCRYDTEWSDQVDTTVKAAAGGALLALGGLALYALFKKDKERGNHSRDYWERI